MAINLTPKKNELVWHNGSWWRIVEFIKNDVIMIQIEGRNVGSRLAIDKSRLVRPFVDKNSGQQAWEVKPEMKTKEEWEDWNPS